MKSIIMALLAMGDVTVRGLPVAKLETPMTNLPELQLGFEQQDTATILRYNPCLSIQYPLWGGRWLTNPIEITYILYRLEYQNRLDISHTWKNHVLAINLCMADEIKWEDGEYYNLEATHDITGATNRDYHRYRLVVEVNGFISYDLSASHNIHNQFSDTFCSPWVYASGHPIEGKSKLNTFADDYVGQSVNVLSHN